MRKPSFFGVVVTLLLVTACGKPLGEYRVRDVAVVAAHSEPDRQDVEKADTEMLRIEFTSKTDLYAASDGGHEGLYVFTTTCPYDEDRTLYVGEPYYDDRSRYGPTRTLERKVLPDGRIIEKVDSNDRRPSKNRTTGEFTYTTYLALERVAKPARSGSGGQIAYNLRREQQELCLRVNHPGYFITPSRSQVFKVPAELIRKALLGARPTYSEPSTN